MAASTFLVIGAVGMVLLVVSAFLGADDADLDMDADLDIDLEADTDTDVHAAAAGGGILEWFSIKGIAVGAVGFGFVGWATTSNGYSTSVVWLLSIIIGIALWAGASFQDMIKRHAKTIAKHPHLPLGTGVPYEGIENLRPESELARKVFASWH